jgi:L-threonylcarbamoyladenylate synthase
MTTTATTQVWTIADGTAPTDAELAPAAELLRIGELVAFPTETVYGLGANAWDAAAVTRIFTAKGRPSTNPVIVHTTQPRSLTPQWPDAAEALAQVFWPGPLTLVLQKLPTLPEVVTAGGPTVGVRVPAHPVARRLLELAGVPVAAPSANRSLHLSPTTAAHVFAGLAGRIAGVVDGGTCPDGIESTVVDVTDRPRLLRPGPISRAMLEAVVGPVEVGAASTEGIARAPGQLARHYAPRTPLRLVPRGSVLPGPNVLLCLGNARTYAQTLYAMLHALDAAGHPELLVEEPPDLPEWFAVRDRLRRAATS